MRSTLALFISLVTLFGMACSNDPNVTREQAAKTTEQLKRDSREAAGQIKKGAEVARTDVTAAAEGVKEGLNDKSSSTVDVNNADKAQLMGLPGIDSSSADSIIAHRPYRSASELVSKRAISEEEYRRISSRVTAGQ